MWTARARHPPLQLLQCIHLGAFQQLSAWIAISQGGDAREVTDRVDIFATNFAHLVDEGAYLPERFCVEISRTARLP
jgi:hypothetical protein